MSSHLDYEINKELGECYLFMGDLEKAEEYYTKAAGSNGVHPDPYLGLATIAVQRGDLPGALTLYRKAAGITPNDKSVAGMGLVEMEIGAHGEAFSHFSEALSINPENVIAIFGIVQLGHALDRLEEVVPFLSAYLDIDPHKDNIRFTLAGCLAKLGRAEEAGSQLERILEHDPAHDAAKELLEAISRN